MHRNSTWTVAFAAALAIALAPVANGQVNVPAGINHQGYVEVNGTPFDGTGEFRFAIVDSGGNNLWAHDGTQTGTSNMPDTSVSLPVGEGVYSVMLGGGLTDPIPASIYTNSGLELRVWFGDGVNGVQQLGSQPLLSVPFAQAAVTAKSTESVPDQITVNSVVYANPRTHTLSLPPTAFILGTTRNNVRVGNAVAVATEGFGTLFAPLYLPDGATITELEVFFEDNDDDSDVEVALTRGFHSSNSNSNMARVTTQGLSGLESANDTTVDDPTVDNALFDYQLVAEDMSGDWDEAVPDNMSILSAKITYTLSEAR